MYTLEEQVFPNMATPLPTEPVQPLACGQSSTKGTTRSERRQTVERLLAERQVRPAGLDVRVTGEWPKLQTSSVCPIHSKQAADTAELSLFRRHRGRASLPHPATASSPLRRIDLSECNSCSPSGAPSSKVVHSQAIMHCGV